MIGSDIARKVDRRISNGVRLVEPSRIAILGKRQRGAQCDSQRINRRYAR